MLLEITKGRFTTAFQGEITQIHLEDNEATILLRCELSHDLKVKLQWSGLSSREYRLLYGADTRYCIVEFRLKADVTVSMYPCFKNSKT